jgi:hypothetical protein
MVPVVARASLAVKSSFAVAQLQMLFVTMMKWPWEEVLAAVDAA